MRRKLLTAVAIAVLAAMAFLFVVRGVVQDRRNGEGIAWVAPKGERVDLAAAGIAVTEKDEGRTLIGRDLDTGEQRWRHEFDWPTGFQPNDLQRVGRTLLVVDRVEEVHALDLNTGEERWSASPGGNVQPSVATPDVVALTVCPKRPDCRAEVRSLADGEVRWQAPVSSAGELLGSPDVGDPPNEPAGLWPAGYVVLRPRGHESTYAVREVATGKVVLRGTGARESVAVAGNLLIRAGQRGPTTALDLATGRVAWRFDEPGLGPMRAGETEIATLGMPDGGLLMSIGFEVLPEASVGDEVRVLDPRTGELTVHRADLHGTDTEVVATVHRPITATAVAEPAAPAVPAVRSLGQHETEIYDGERVYRLDDYERNSIAATRSQVGWEAHMRRFGAGENDGVEVRDRRTGERLVRYVGDGGAVDVRSAGDRLVIDGGSRESVVAP